jgi:hypothetical protein
VVGHRGRQIAASNSANLEEVALTTAGSAGDRSHHERDRELLGTSGADGYLEWPVYDSTVLRKKPAN